MKATVENVKEVILQAEVLGDVKSLRNDISLREQGIDSLDVVNVYLLLEEKFDVKIPDEDLGFEDFYFNRAAASSSGFKNLPVSLFGCAAISCGVPVQITFPPPAPPSGPMSII